MNGEPTYDAMWGAWITGWCTAWSTAFFRAKTMEERKMLRRLVRVAAKELRITEKMIEDDPTSRPTGFIQLRDALKGIDKLKTKKR